MPIVILAPPETSKRFASFLHPGCRVETVNLSGALAVLASAEHGCIVIDPSGLRENECEHVANAVYNAKILTVLYTTLSTPHRLRMFAAASPIELILIGGDCESILIPEVVRLGRAPTTAAEIRHRLGRRLWKLSPELELAVNGLFASARIPASVAQLATKVDLDPATVSRQLRRAGLAGASDVLTAARVARLFDALQSTRQGLEMGASAFVGRSTRAVHSAFHYFTGLPPRRAMRALTSAECARRVVERLVE